MVKQVHISALMPLVDEARDPLLDWTVGLVKAVPAKRPPDEPPFDAVLAGSGVLVTAKGRHAILTADHVMENLPKSGPIGLILLRKGTPQDHQYTVEMEHMERITLGRGTDDQSGPDLALIVLPAVEARRLQVYKSFYNLSMRREKMLALPPPTELKPWVMGGLLGEMTSELEPRVGKIRQFNFKGLCGPVILRTCRREGRFDYLSAEVNYGKQYNLPKTFGGYSGSGAWHMVVREKDGKLASDQLVLGGIAFYENRVTEDKLTIECHGIHSIYDVAENALGNAPQS
jgi:hypothetical protein